MGREEEGRVWKEVEEAKESGNVEEGRGESREEWYGKGEGEGSVEEVGDKERRDENKG